MTNKPMLSVELRSFLEGVVKLCAVHGPTYNELRAILDEQSCGACNGCANGCKLDRESPQVEPVLESQYAGMTQDQKQAVSDGVDEILHGEPAAQHRGEPVAWSCDKPSTPGAYWIRGFNLSGNTDQSALVHVVLDEDEQVLMVNLHQSTTETDTGYWYEVDDINQEFEWCGPLYAEQPAPVAVVLPERELYMKYLVGVIPHNASEVNAYKDGWNACLEEVARLNWVKP